MDTNVQVEVTIPTKEPTITETSPSGEATSPSEKSIKDKSLEEKKGEIGREPIFGPSLLSIDTS